MLLFAQNLALFKLSVQCDKYYTLIYITDSSLLFFHSSVKLHILVGVQCTGWYRRVNLPPRSTQGWYLTVRNVLLLFRGKRTIQGKQFLINFTIYLSFLYNCIKFQMRNICFKRGQKHGLVPA